MRGVRAETSIYRFSTAPIQTLYIPSAFYRPSGSLRQSITDPSQALYKLYSLYSPVEPPRAQASEQQRRQRSWRDPLQTLDGFSTTALQILYSSLSSSLKTP